MHTRARVCTRVHVHSRAMMGLRACLWTLVRSCMPTRARVCTRLHASQPSPTHARAHACTRARACTHAPPRPRNASEHACTNVHAYARMRLHAVRQNCMRVCALMPAGQPATTDVCAHACTHVHTYACMLANHSHACHPVLSPAPPTHAYGGKHIRAHTRTRVHAHANTIL